MDIKNYIEKSINTKKEILNNKSIILDIQKIANIIIDSYRKNNKVLIAGNGGSASDAQHIATELVSKFLKDGKALNAIALNTNTSIITAIANDCSYDDIFSRQIEANGVKNDIFIAISTSGNSKNIIKALKTAKNKDLFTIGLTGQKKCEMDELCDYIIKVPSDITPIIQETHIMLGHIICALVEEKLR